MVESNGLLNRRTALSRTAGSNPVLSVCTGVRTEGADSCTHQGSPDKKRLCEAQTKFVLRAERVASGQSPRHPVLSVSCVLRCGLFILLISSNERRGIRKTDLPN